jgi:hypothetical protein
MTTPPQRQLLASIGRRLLCSLAVALAAAPAPAQGTDTLRIGYQNGQPAGPAKSAGHTRQTIGRAQRGDQVG